jgi:hypothetical protein
MYYWISSKPLKMIITQSINYRKKKGKIFEEDTRNLVDFIPENPKAFSSPNRSTKIL